ncbi:Cytochrome P450-like protein 46 [Elsinoe fawcettii]|nr:Cytochrome P450-like protein 46 [Elsinoe fawcettii]
MALLSIPPELPVLILLILPLIVLPLYLSASLRPPKDTTPPPGPPGLPLLGNLPQLPPYHSWFRFLSWSRLYGPLYRISLLGAPHVIVSTERIANDLLRERGNIYSDRTQGTFASELLSRNLRPLLLPYGETWRKVRRLMHALCNREVSMGYVPTQEEETLRAVRDLIRRPERYEVWFERFSAGLILRLAYGIKVITGEEEQVRRIMKVNTTLERVASPGAYLVDSLPWLMRLPEWLAGWKKEGKRLHEEEVGLFRELLEEGTRRGEGNFCEKWAEKEEGWGLGKDHVAYTIGTLFEAGAGTTMAAMQSFMLSMVLHLGEFRKLQKEVDTVVGNGRVPCYEDMPKLPRVRAVAKEVMRWRPVTAGGLPHMLSKDDTYELPDGEKVFLQAGTNIHPVQWNIHREEALYPDPESFRPERWLEDKWPTYKEPLSIYPNLQNFSSFGFGRRICPGQNIAERSLYLLISTIAWSCDLRLKKDEKGNEIVPPHYDYVVGFNTHPKWFPFELKARADRHTIIEKEYQKPWSDL